MTKADDKTTIAPVRRSRETKGARIGRFDQAVVSMMNRARIGRFDQLSSPPLI